MKLWTKPKKIITIFAVVIVVALLGGTIYSLPFKVKPVNEQPTPSVAYDGAITPESMVKELNSLREQAGAPDLALDNRLNASAQQKCEEMANERSYGHENLEGVQGYTYAHEKLGLEGYYSENLIGRSPNETPSQVFNSWFTSAPHKKAALEPHNTLTGFGICDNPYAVNPNQLYIVEHFYSPVPLN